MHWDINVQAKWIHHTKKKTREILDVYKEEIKELDIVYTIHTQQTHTHKRNVEKPDSNTHHVT